MMGHELRKVPGNWVHPTNESGYVIPMHDGVMFTKKVARKKMWEQGFYQINDGPLLPVAQTGMTFEEYEGEIDPDKYMPDWPITERTHYVWYETYSEGAPISSVCASAEELAVELVALEEFKSSDDALDFIFSEEKRRYPIRTIEQIENEIELAKARLKELECELASKRAALK